MSSSDALDWGAASGMKQLEVEHHVVDRDGSAGLTPRRLEHDDRLDAELLGLTLREEAEAFAGNDDRRWARASACLEVERSPTNGRNCFGMGSRETGHRRVPEPPARTTGKSKSALLS